MLYFDVTKRVKSRHQSGLTRVSLRLLEALRRRDSEQVVEVYWDARKQCLRRYPEGKVLQPTADDWFLTPELFDESSRPGFKEFLYHAPVAKAAIFHDAIPLRHPEFTWPQSVARHPFYMKLLARFDKVFTVSEATGVDLAEYWDWLRLKTSCAVHAIHLGADFNGRERVAPAQLPPWQERSQILMVGILEPRKNQDTALDALSFLWKQSFPGSLAVVGRVNPHFGQPLQKRLKKLAKAGFPITYHGQVDDETLEDLYRQSRFTLFPSIAEGCGLPLLESMWMGVPVLANPIPSVQENASGGGCHLVNCRDPDVLSETLLQRWEDATLWERLSLEVSKRKLPVWDDTAREVLEWLDDPG